MLFRTRNARATNKKGLAVRMAIDADDNKYSKKKRLSYASLNLQSRRGLLFLVIVAATVLYFIVLSTKTTSKGVVDDDDNTSHDKNRRLERLFAENRMEHKQIQQLSTTETSVVISKTVEKLNDILQQWIDQVDKNIYNNVHSGMAWPRPWLLASFPDGQTTKTQKKQQQPKEDAQQQDYFGSKNWKEEMRTGGRIFFENTKHLPKYDPRVVDKQNDISSSDRIMKWQQEWHAILQHKEMQRGPVVDYADKTKYIYPKLTKEMITSFGNGQMPSLDVYPQVRPLREFIEDWHQDDDMYGTIHETVYRFNASNVDELRAAEQFRKHELPFVMYDVPEMNEELFQKWSNDEYIANGIQEMIDKKIPHSRAALGLSNNFFMYYDQTKWQYHEHGISPFHYVDWDYMTYAQHARFADHSRLDADQPHFYYQVQIEPGEKYSPNIDEEWSFISKDLPHFSSQEPNLYQWTPWSTLGIECRFGERGVTTGTHYDDPRNMMAIVTGARRYIVSPPRECSKLGVEQSMESPLFRQSLLNFGHLAYMDHPDMPPEEKRWLERAGEADSVQIVVRQGEIMYIPSNWFHYIITLQQTIQCNLRTTGEFEPHPVFGDAKTVEQCQDY